MSDLLPDLIEEVISHSELNDTGAGISEIIAQADEDEVALLLESLPIEERLSLWQSIPDSKKLDVLIEMRGDPREVLIRATEADTWDKLFVDIDAEDLLELADSLPEALVDRAYSAMDRIQRQYFTDANQYPEDQVGHWVTHDMLVLPHNARVRDGIRLIRRKMPRHTDNIFLINRSGHFSDAVPIAKLYALAEHIPLVDVALEDFPIISAADEGQAAAKAVLFSSYGGLPVVDENHKLIGRIDVTTASELNEEYFERQLMASAGMDENEDLFASVRKSARGRAIWLGINLLTAFLASAFISMFEATLQQVVALAVLMPVVASMGGIAGSQTLTLIIRGLALKQVTPANMKILLSKEVRVGGLNGVIWAIVIGIVAFSWFSDPLLGFVIAVAIFLNIVSAAVAGVFIPILLDKLKVDPALSGSVILTTVTDVVGFVTFLGLGTLILV